MYRGFLDHLQVHLRHPCAARGICDTFMTVLEARHTIPFTRAVWPRGMGPSRFWPATGRPGRMTCLVINKYMAHHAPRFGGFCLRTRRLCFLAPALAGSGDVCLRKAARAVRRGKLALLTYWWRICLRPAKQGGTCAGTSAASRVLANTAEEGFVSRRPPEEEFTSSSPTRHRHHLAATPGSVSAVERESVYAKFRGGIICRQAADMVCIFVNTLIRT
jgi:hypothetical protein